MLPWVQVKVSSLTATTRPKSGWICQTWSEDQAGLNAGKTRGIHEVCRGISYISHIWKVLIVWVICMKFFMQFWDSLTRVQRFGHNRLPGKVDSLLYIIIYLIPSKQCSMQPRILFTFFHCQKLRIHKKKTLSFNNAKAATQQRHSTNLSKGRFSPNSARPKPKN